MTALPVAFDVGPLLGRRTGIGVAVAALEEQLDREPTIDVVPYVLSARHRPPLGVRRLPFPAAAAHRVWQRVDHPTIERFLRDARVIHGTNYVVPPSRQPRVVSVYDCWFLRNPDRSRPDVVRAGRLLARALGRGAVAHASSSATADGLRELFPAAEVRTIPLAALTLPDPAPTCPIGGLDGRRFVLSISTIERRKNLTALVRAFGRIATTADDLLLVLAGAAGDDVAAVHEAIDQLPAELAGRVMLTGFVDDAVRSWLLHNATALCYPSLDEGFGFPLLDAMQAGTPIVATSAGSIPEVVGDAAVLVAVGDLDALADGLEKVCSDGELRRRLVAAGGLRTHGYSWATTAASLTALYHELDERGQ